jgi:hypothetical protein
VLMMQSTALNHPIRKTHIEPVIAEFQNLIPLLQDESTKLESAVKVIRAMTKTVNCMMFTTRHAVKSGGETFKVICEVLLEKASKENAPKGAAS